jgi:metal-responsive CopG/Arc/MetJ family transcriptional regulator
MSKPITIKLQDHVLKDAERFMHKSKLKSRNAYINEAVRRLNALLAREELAKAYREQSQIIRDESAAVLAEFEALPDDLAE